MKRSDIVPLAIVVLLSIIIAQAVAGRLGSSDEDSTKIPVVQPISGTLPDIKNDPDYNKFFNRQALDPTQPVQVGDGNNPGVFR